MTNVSFKTWWVERSRSKCRAYSGAGCFALESSHQSGFTIPIATQRPKPVPFSPLVVKNGIKDAMNVGCRECRLVVGNGNPDTPNHRVLPVRRFASGDGNGASCGDGLLAFRSRVENTLANLARIGLIVTPRFIGRSWPTRWLADSLNAGMWVSDLMPAQIRIEA